MHDALSDPPASGFPDPASTPLHHGDGREDSAAVPDAAASRKHTTFHIREMDCPAEEALIRRHLAALPGVLDLKFDLLQQRLTITHTLSGSEPLIAALTAIDMTPAPVPAQDWMVSSFLLTVMDCAEQEERIRNRLASLPGIFCLECDPVARTLTVRHRQDILPLLHSTLAELDPSVHVLNATLRENVPDMPLPGIPWKRLAIAGIFALCAEGFELARTTGMFRHFGLHLPPADLDTSWPVLVCSILAIALSGLGTYRRGWLAISACTLDMHALMAVAVTGAVLVGQFPEAAMVMVLFNLSEAIEAKALQHARQSIRHLLDLAPQTGLVLQADGSFAAQDIRSIPAGSRMRIRPGERIGLDGIIVSGHSAVDQSPITGESLPLEKKAGDTVHAGTINLSGALDIEVTSTAAHSTLAKIVEAVEQAQASRAPIQRFVDRFARYYTPAIFLTALLVGLLLPLACGQPWRQSIHTALVVLVIGCPCALVISTPVTIVAALTAATRRGILIKGGVFLEAGRKLTCLALDKTGTITLGKPRLTDLFAADHISPDLVLSLACSLAAGSEHPVSQAIARHGSRHSVPLLPATDLVEIPGRGICGTIGARRWKLGNLHLLAATSAFGPELEDRMHALEQAGKTVVFLLDDHGVQGLLAVADTIRPSSREAVRDLGQLGVKTVMLTGDSRQIAAIIAKEVGIADCRGGLLPADKLEAVDRLKSAGENVGMVGDGINDAPALARADIGFSMAAGGTDIAIETADVALMDDDLRKIPLFIRLSRATHTILLQNIGLALGIKALFFGLGLAGITTMWMAVFADVGTSLIVIANGLRAMAACGEKDTDQRTARCG